ncbi:MAG: hypothetical protein U5O16_21100 [Rhodococcus sp. (in: high G+C Gram-positive bacteria)]|uniref:hypothetical protein n=1 Tax=Rhodococcus sp. TaxID=1831 RepID=UPI002AD9A215|nr:hypothetical protein [Rhodococcus sp. (in: high G+C Gram-positive bacteria)]
MTEMQRGSSGYSSGYRGVRKTSNGFAIMSGDERRYEGASVTFSRFEDAVKGYAAEVIGSFRMHLSGRYLGYVAWMWNGTTGPGVVAQPLNRSNTQFHYSLEGDPSIWLEGRTTAATLSHGLGMLIPAFIAAVIGHPKVTGKDATAWPKPVQP